MNTSSTSIAARDSIKDDLQRLERIVLSYLRGTPATCDEIEAFTGLPHQTVSARLNGLEKRGRIEKTASKRPTRSGRMAFVYAVVPQQMVLGRLFLNDEDQTQRELVESP